MSPTSSPSCSKWGAIALPMGWLLIFFLIPLFIVLRISFSEVDEVRPYKPLTEQVTNEAGETHTVFQGTLSNYHRLFEDRLYIQAVWNSFKTALICTLISLIIGFALAYAITRCKPSTRYILLLLVTLPFWTSSLIRVYAWMGILKSEGLLNQTFLWLGFISEPLIIMNTQWAVYIGVVSCYLPYMILPLYASLERLDPRWIEAASDLGSPPIKTFWTIIVPLAKPGIVAGCLLVFIPTLGEFVIPSLLGGSDTTMLGQVLWDEFFNNRDWPMASALAIVLLLIILVPMVVFEKRQMKGAAS